MNILPHQQPDEQPCHLIAVLDDIFQLIQYYDKYRYNIKNEGRR
jgi:hypothetical protein